MRLCLDNELAKFMPECGTSFDRCSKTRTNSGDLQEPAYGRCYEALRLLYIEPFLVNDASGKSVRCHEEAGSAS